MRDQVGKSEGKQTGPGFEIKTGVGTGVKLLNTHGVQLTVDDLNRLAVKVQVVVIRPGVGRHVTATGGDEAHARFGPNRRRIRVRNITLIGQDRGSGRQVEG